MDILCQPTSDDKVEPSVTKTDIQQSISSNTNDSDALTVCEIVSADDILGSVCDCMLHDASTELLVDLYKRIAVEVSKRQDKNPISKLDEWRKRNPRRKVMFTHNKTNSGWLTSVTVFDEFRKRHFSWNQQDFSVEVSQPKKLSKKLAAADMVQQLSI